MAEDVVRHKKIYTAVYDEFNNLLKYEEREIELHESQETRRPTSRPAATTNKKVKKPPYLGIGDPPREAGVYGWLLGSRKQDIPLPRRGPQRPITPHLTQCPRCGLMIKTSRLEVHIARAHPVVKRKGAKKSPPKLIFQNWGTKEKAVPSTTKHQLVTCPECKVSIRQDRLDEHLRKVHGQEKLTTVSEPDNQDSGCEKVGNPKIHPKPDAQSKPQPFNDPKSLVACPMCGVFVRNDHLGKHLRKAHPQAPAQRKGSPAKAGKVFYKGGTDAAFEHSRIEREQDGNKNIGYLARERGRFGSHPMHDDYNDEGGAD